ncbi:Major Facilitator Superfamily protein [Raineyella antarctica]|uniref:Major Facilitator Superfamily protein n=1 Tax=Raineyella antarctica TaxID=1577474 RepID=A0A1G6GXA8_9ACTN|nr:MFS transporter [Raineyella antarctica]SDB86667.1 Major Facilitator Superfamily protein [Raineyella antarctica]
MNAAKGDSLPGARSVLGVVFLATILMSLSSNMLNIAVPALTSHFGSSAGESSLVVVAYQLVNTALLIPAGQVADALDRRITFLGGLGFFALVSLLMGFSPSMLGVAAGRALQGAAAALLLSNAVAILASVFPSHRLAAAMGVYLSGFSLGQVLGPMVGGFIVSTIGWRWLFWILVPIALTALVWGLWALRIMPAGRPRTLRLDVPGAVLLAIILGGSQLALSLAAQAGFGNPTVLLVLAICVALVPVLVLVERRLRHPVLAADLFRNRAFPLALVQGFLVMLPRLGAVTVAGLWFQGVAGDTAALSAVKIVGFPLGLTIGSLVGDRIGRRWGTHLSMAVSAGVATTGMGLMLWNVALSADWLTVLALGVVGLGNGVFQTLNSSLIITSTPRERTGVVNSVRVMVQSFGAGIGLALAMALVVAFVPGEVARTFLSGDAAALGTGRTGISAGYSVAYATFAILMVLGTLATLIRTERRR